MNDQPILVLHTGRTTQTLQAGQPHKFKAKAGEHYRIVKRQGDVEQLLGDVIAKRRGDDLQLSYVDGTQVTLENYYDECKALTACDLTLPGPDGRLYRPGTEASAGVAVAEGGQMVYAHGSPDNLMTMAAGDPAVKSTFASLRGDQITYIPSDAKGWAFGLFATPWLLSGRGGGGTPAAAGADTVAPALASAPWGADDNVGPKKGAIADHGATDDARPSFAGSGAEPGTSVTLYESGMVLGTATVGADGTWRCTPSSDLSNGVHQVSYRLTDSAGNQSALSAAIQFTVDTVAPDALGVGLDPADDGDSGNGVSLLVTIGPNAKAGDSAQTQIFRDGTLVETISSVLSQQDIDSGSLTVQVAASSVGQDGLYSATVQLSDAAGNLGPAVAKPSAFTVFTGLVHDDYLANAFVFVDTNRNNKWDDGEATTRTDANGFFKFAFDPQGAPVLAMGGVDTASGAPNSSVVYKAYSGSIDASAAGVDIVLSPLSSLIAAVAEQASSNGQVVDSAALLSAASIVNSAL